MKKILFTALWLTSILAALTGCKKDPDYSIEKINNADPEITLFENGVSMSIDSVKTFKLAEFLESAVGKNITTDPDGTYRLNVSGYAIDTTLTVPTISIQKPAFKTVDKTIPTGALAGTTVSTGVKKPLSPTSLDCATTIELNKYTLPEGVVDIKEINIELPLTLKFATGTSLMYISSGTALTFPKGISVTKKSSETWFSIKESDGRAQIYFNEDKQIQSTLSIGLLITKLTIQSGWISGNSIQVSETASLKGAAGVIGPGTVPASFALKMSAEAGTLVTKDALLKYDKTFNIGHRQIKLNLPDILKDGTNKLLFNEAGAALSVDSKLPVPFTFNGKVNANRDNVTKKTVNISNLTTEANGKKTFDLSEATFPGITDIVNCVPDEVTLTDMRIKAASEGFITVEQTKKYAISATYDIHTPLVFRKGSKFSFAKTFKNKLDLGTDAKVSAVELEVIVENGTSVTIGMDLSAVIDNEDVTLKQTDGTGLSVAPGEKKTFRLSATKADGSTFRNIGDITTKVAASVENDKAAIRNDQSVTFTIKSVCLPGGITINTK